MTINNPGDDGGLRKYGRVKNIIPEQGVPNLRSAVMEQYMRALGVGAPPEPPRQEMPLTDQRRIVDELNVGAHDANFDNPDPNVFFQQIGADDDVPDEDLEGQVQRENMRKPTYVDPKGRPSANPEFDDETLLERARALMGL